jgi:succinyl-diaminopimelate desuccinylase
VFNGHVDTLDPGDERTWSTSPYRLDRRDGQLIGLGIGNMKAGVAALTIAFIGLSRRREEIAGSVLLTIVADEVVFGTDGAAFLLERDPTLLGDALINAEGPGAMNVAVAEKGVLWLEVEAKAPPGQGMLTVSGHSAITRLSRLLLELDAWNEEHVEPPAGMEALRVGAGEHGLRLSVNVGTIVGGCFVSQVAERARAEIDFRAPPGMTIETLEARVEARAAEIGGLSILRIKGWNPSWIAIDHALTQAMLAASAAVRGKPTFPVVRLPASDAARWRARGVPAICYGPQFELASSVNDYVFENDVVDCVAVYMAAALAICAPQN